MKVDWFRRIPFSFGTSIPLHDNPSSISAVYQIVERFVLSCLSLLPRYLIHPCPEHHTGLHLKQKGKTPDYGGKEFNVRHEVFDTGIRFFLCVVPINIFWRVL